MANKLLCILFGNGGTAPNLLHNGLKKLDSDFVIFYIKPQSDSLRNIYEEWLPKFGDYYEVESHEDMKKSVLNYSNAIREINGVITFSEKLLSVASKVAARLNLPFNSISSIEKTQNKFSQRNLLKENGIPIPKYFLLKEVGDIEKAIEYIGFPAVLKPVYGSGSYFVQSIKNKEELYTVYNTTITDYKNLMSDSSDSMHFLLEEEMIGENYHRDLRYGDYASIESIIFKGEINHLCIVDRLPLAEPFRETGFLLPSKLSNSRQNELFLLAEKSIKALDLTYGFTHIEVKFTAEGPKIIEVNARPGGGFPYRLNLACPDYDLFYEFGKLSLNIAPNIKPNFKSCSGSIIIQSPNNLVSIEKIKGMENLKEISGVNLSITVAKEGDKIDPRKGLQNIIAFFYLTGDSHDKIFSSAKEIEKIFVIEYTSINH